MNMSQVSGTAAVAAAALQPRGCTPSTAVRPPALKATCWLRLRVAHVAELLEDPAEAEHGDDGNGVAAPALLDEPDAHAIGNVGRELLVLGARELVEEGELACQLHHLAEGCSLWGAGVQFSALCTHLF